MKHVSIKYVITSVVGVLIPRRVAAATPTRAVRKRVLLGDLQAS